MAAFNFDAIIWCEKPPEFELRGPNVHIMQRMGKDTRTERVMSRHTFLRSYHAAGKIVERINSDKGSVVTLRRRKDAKPAH